MPSPFLASHWVHDLSPFLIRFSESFGIRWYGLAYVIGFLGAYLMLKWLVRKDCSELREDQVADFITYGALLGVMLGGRLGYMLFYSFDEFIHRPWIFFQFLQGGMASHGGILGLVIFTWVYARVTKLSWPGLGDNLVTVSPIGIFFGRVANFINGELYGHVTQSPIGVIFPRALGEENETIVAGVLNRFHASSVEVLVEMSRTNTEIQAALAEILPPRHPSQLYEAAVEGLLLFLILLAVRLRWKNLYHGILTGLFFILYAIGRILVENVRVPDAERILGLTRGQFYSTFMLAIGAAFIIWGFKTKRRNAPARTGA
ncbi:MAG: prolipoprotein diacylglyceryl transferase [Verrucomicrobiae bacterium]|nr:prolipoprotein diacylglyceryl transferase [Verrucomicrobiae bacterium]